MKKFSWEIIIAGILFIAVAMYLIGKHDSNNDYNYETAVSATPEDAPHPAQVHVIDLKNLEELAALQELQNLEELGELEHLAALKELAHLIPAETRDMFLTEIDNAIREFTNEDIEINFDATDKLIIVNREYSGVQNEWSNTSPGIYTFQNEFDASDLDNITVKLPYGSITIVGTNDSQAKLTVQASGQIESVQDLESHISTVAKVFDGNGVFKIEANGSGHEHNIQLQAILNIPQEMELVTTTESGHIEITNVQGEQIHKTGGGHIVLNKVHGEVTAVSEGGHISIENSSGEFQIRSNGGHLKATNCEGEIFLKTTGGNIEAINIDGELIASTKGGNIIIDLSVFSNDVTAETLAGNIKILLPSGTNADIELKASHAVELSGINFNGSKQKTSLKGSLNAGGPDIIALTKHGQITVKSND